MLSHKKRNDIQGLRAIAIFGVLLFHLYPQRFVNGFLGVDTFFVLSGYLMASILSREPSIDCNVVKSFYARRFKRIVPLYSIMLAVLSVATPFIFLPSDISHFVTDLEWALPFAENMQNVLKRVDYWDEVFSSPVLLHAWSLGVEIQYYLLVPLIITVARFGQTRRFRLITFAVIMTGSYVLHRLTPSSVSFGLLFSRVWQFLTGNVFFELEGIVDNKNSSITGENKMDKQKLLEEEADGFDNLKIAHSTYYKRVMPVALSYSVTGYLVWMTIISSSEPTTSRLLVTLATGSLLLCGKFTQIGVLSNVVVVHIGDLSYLIYLTHWPVIILYKYYNDITDLTLTQALLCAFLTLALSDILHRSLERFFIQSSMSVAFAFVSFIYAVIILLLLVNAPLRLSNYAHEGLERGHQSSGQQINIPEVIRYNYQQSRIVYLRNPAGCVRDYEAERWSNYTAGGEMRCLSKSNGTAKVLVMGNSYGYRAFPVLRRLFAGRYSQMRMFTKSSFVFLTLDEKGISETFTKAERIVLEKFQPDITFLIEKDYFLTLMKPISGTVEDDLVRKQLKASVDILSKNSGTVVIDQQYYKPHGNGVAYTIQKRMQQGNMKLDDLSVSRKEYEAEFANERARMATINKSNVIVNDVQSQLCPGDQCYFYDRDNLHAYYGDVHGHLTSEGLKHLERKYAEIIEDFLLRMERRKEEAKL